MGVSFTEDGFSFNILGAIAVPNTYATATLLLHIQQGDEQAIDRLYRRYQDRVLTAVRYRLGRKLRQKVESADVVQDVLLGALKKVHSFDFRTEGAFLHYLNRLVENRIRDEARHWDAGKREIAKEQAFIGKRSDADGNPLTLQDDHCPTPSSIVSAKEDYAMLEQAMDQLGESNPEYRDLIVTAKLEGMSYAEIADESEKSADAVRMQLRRAMVELTKIFRDLEGNG